MNLRDDKNNKKKLEEFNTHSTKMAEIILKRKEILDEVNIAPGQIWENVKGKRVVVSSINGNTINFINKTGKHAFNQGKQSKEVFENELFIYIGTASDTMVKEFFDHDGRESGLKEEIKNKRAVPETVDLPF